MKKKYIPIGLIALLMSCNTSNETDKNSEDMTPAKVVETSKKSSEISLNDGKKWRVNDDMLPHIEKSEAVFNAFEGDNYTKLSQDMMKHTNNLIQSCTMYGASHDELHKWLHPHIELLKSLSIEGSEEEKEENMSAIEKSFNTFHKYFK